MGFRGCGPRRSFPTMSRNRGPSSSQQVEMVVCTFCGEFYCTPELNNLNFASFLFHPEGHSFGPTSPFIAPSLIYNVIPHSPASRPCVLCYPATLTREECGGGCYYYYFLRSKSWGLDSKGQIHIHIHSLQSWAILLCQHTVFSKLLCKSQYIR